MISPKVSPSSGASSSASLSCAHTSGHRLHERSLRLDRPPSTAYLPSRARFLPAQRGWWLPKTSRIAPQISPIVAPCAQRFADRGQQVRGRRGRRRAASASARGERLGVARGSERAQARDLVALGGGVDAQGPLDAARPPRRSG